jgi:protoporphyrin/coproporphyrin ferrochelatase
MGAGSRMKKTAVVLFNLGAPASEKDIYPFLFSLFYDPAILSFPNPLRYVLAKVIATTRLPKAKSIYIPLGGGSPLLQNTRAQASSLEKGYRVFVAMRHAPPLIPDVFKDIRAFEPDEVVLLPLYPQYSTTTTESAFKAWKKAAQGWNIPTYFISSYSTQMGFLRALYDLTHPLYEKAQKHGSAQVLLTAHGLPEKTIKKGDPYQSQVEETSRKFAEILSLKDTILCYQSRVGPLKWIGPSLEEEIIKASRLKRPLVIVPLSFVSEHSETLVELDMTLKDLALKEGCPAYERVPTVHIHPFFIEGLASLVKLASCKTL